MPTWQSRKKIAKNAMKFITFWIATLLSVARNDVWGIHTTTPINLSDEEVEFRVNII